MNRSISKKIPFEVLHWNIQDGKSVSGPKQDDPDFLEILQGKSIFCLQETKGPISIPGYLCYNKLREKSRSGGVCTGIAREIATRWKAREVFTGHEDILAVNLSPPGGDGETPLLVVNVYDSPSHSSYKRHNVGNQTSVMETLLNMLLNHQYTEILLCGDMNARTRTLNHDLVETSTEHEDSPRSHQIRSDRTRSSKDTRQADARGKQLIDLLASLNATLLNGNCVGDITGEYTCVKYNGSSVVDYTAVTSGLYNMIKSYQVLDLNVLSDHRPCLTKLAYPGPRITEETLLADLDPAPRRGYRTKTRMDDNSNSNSKISDYNSHFENLESR